MSEEPKPSPQPSADDLATELNQLGERLGLALKGLWESPERKDLERELSEGLHVVGQKIDQVVDAAKDRLVAENVPQQAQQVAESVEKNPVTQEVSEALLNGLRFLNRELSRVTKEEPSAPSSGTSAEEPKVSSQ